MLNGRWTMKRQSMQRSRLRVSHLGADLFNVRITLLQATPVRADTRSNLAYYLLAPIRDVVALLHGVPSAPGQHRCKSALPSSFPRHLRASEILPQSAGHADSVTVGRPRQRKCK